MSTRKWRVLGALALVSGLAGLGGNARSAEASPEDGRSQIAALPWVKGPADVPVGDKAKLTLAQDQAFLAEKDSGRFMELTGNLPSPGESVLVGNNWWAVFGYSSVGYVKDDEKLDPDALLIELKSTDGPANEERRKRGLREMHTDGWAVPPHYDTETKRLEWGLLLHSEGSTQPTVNYTVRVLGRKGFENVVLVSSREELDQNVLSLKTTLKSFDFNTGEKYSEFRAGDHVAEFGLGALVLGGTAAALVKTGFWKSILLALAAGWKLVVGAVVVAFASIGKLFGRKSKS